MVSSVTLGFVALTSILMVLTTTAETLDQERSGELSILQKRPFCNAFTGCGRKRSESRPSEFPGEMISAYRQNRLLTLLQQKMAEVEAIKAIMEESRK